MELNITTCYKIFERHYDRISESLGVSKSSRHELASFVAYRALILFKLDLLLIEHRNKVDPDRIVLFGKNTLHHYLFTKKGISFLEIKDLTLQDSLVILFEDLASYSLPTDIDNFLNEEFNFSFSNIKFVKDELRLFKESDWEFELADTRLN